MSKIHQWYSTAHGVSCLRCGLYVDEGDRPLACIDLAEQIACQPAGSHEAHYMTPDVEGICCECCGLTIDAETEGGQSGTCIRYE